MHTGFSRNPALVCHSLAGRRAVTLAGICLADDATPWARGAPGRAERGILP